jgi:hypothetical protein
MTRLVEFAFILAVPLAVVAGVILGLFATGALFNALDHPEQLRQQVDAAFRRPPAAPRSPGRSHYYKPFWASRRAGS